MLSFGLDHHIPSKPNKNMIKTEFEAFYYHINKHLSHLSSDEVDILIGYGDHVKITVTFLL